MKKTNKAIVKAAIALVGVGMTPHRDGFDYSGNAFYVCLYCGEKFVSEHRDTCVWARLVAAVEGAK